MHYSFRIGLGIALLATAACGKDDASGIYVAVADRTVTLVQLVQSPDGKLTGRIQESTITPNGTVNEISANADGSISGHDVLLRPESIWYGGVRASGTVSGHELTLAGADFTLTAERSSLKKYQNAVARLRSVAAVTHQQIADAQTAQDLVKKQAAIMVAVSQLRTDAAKLNAGIGHSPNFGQQAAANTARITRMLPASPTLSGVDRGQLSVAANQIMVGTNQIEVARRQYAKGLNQIVQDAARITAAVRKTCASPERPQFAMQCDEANSAIADFRTAFQHGQTAFTPYKQQVQAELDKQAFLIRR